MAKVTVNGQMYDVDKDVLSYEEVLELAGYPRERCISVTWRQPRPGTGSGCIARGEHVTPVDGVIFNAISTSSA